MKSLFLRITAFVLLATGSFLLTDGCWIRTKAVLAQILLESAWEETMKTGEITKPWPLADTWPVARLRVDRLNIDMIVLEGESGEVLAFGPGHLPVSSVPGGGGHCVLAGHRDTSFQFLQNLQADDMLSLQIQDGSIHLYRIMETTVRKAETLYFQEQDVASLSLVTCYPFDALQARTEYRYIVSAIGVI